jgi:hypothetical protein
MSTKNAVPIASGAGGRPRTPATLILASIGAFVTSLDVVVLSTALPQLRLPSLVPAFIVAGIGISFVFPTLAYAAVGSVPPADSGVAAGSNNTLRETGGLFGVAVLAAVFAAHGGHASPASFMHGIRFALLVAAGAALVAVIPALLGPSRADALATVTDANRVHGGSSPRPSSSPA